MANEGWKQVKVYVASGYFDMQGERQALFNDVLPQLSLMCVPLRVAVSFVDLRVGVHENQFWELLGRSGCTPLLAEIDRCSPFFIGLYGAKYGKQLQEYKFPVEPRWAKISKTYPKGRSVLELETHWAALRDPSRCLPVFCFRDNSFLRSKQFLEDKGLYCAAELSPPLTSRYPERKTDMTIGKTFSSEGEKSRKLMLQLRQTITETYAEVQPEACLFDYPCEYMGPVKQLPMVGKLDKLKDHVKNRLFEYIKKTFPGTNIAADMIEIDSSFHKAVLDQQLMYRFVGRQAEHDSVLEYCFDINEEDGADIYDIVPFIIHGRAGSGNSCLVANVIDTLRDDKSLRNDCVIYHFVGASASSSNARLVLIRLCSLLMRQFDLNFVLPDDFPSLVRCFRLLIKYVVKVRNKRLFLFLDGVDQLDPEYHGQMLHWIPYTCKARVILTMHTGTPTHLAVLQRYEGVIKTLEVGDMNSQACVEMLSERLYRVQKSMSVSQTSALLAKADGKRPLYLALAGNEVMEFGKWNTSISLEGGMDNFVQEFPDTVVGLCKQIINRWISDFPKEIYGNMVVDTLCLLACARHGLSESEVKEMNLRYDPRCFDGAGIKHPDVELPMLMYSDFYERLDPFMRATPRNRIQNLQFRDWSFLRAVQKLYFPDQPKAASLWLKVFGFVVARKKAAEFSTSGAGDGLKLAADAMKNMTARNAEERYHSLISKFFQQHEDGGGRGAWSGRYQRTLLELPYHLIMGRMWGQLEATLLDLRFIESKFRIRMGHDLVQNFVFAVQAKAPEAAKTRIWGPTHKKIQDIHRFVAQNFDTLTTHASKTFQLAANNADTATLAKVALEHWEQGTIRCQWVNYLNKPSELNPLILQMPGHTAPINKVTFTSDGLRIMSASMDSTIRLWDAFSGELIGTIQAHLLPIHSAAFVQGEAGMNVRGVISSSDQFAVTASRDKSIKVWHLDSSKQIKEYTGHVGRVLCCAVKVRKEYDEETEEMVKRTYIATGSWDRSCMIWDLETGEVLQCLGGPEKLNTSDSEGHYNAVTDCCFSPDGSVLCTGSDDETIKLWNWAYAEEIKSYAGHDNSITSVDYSSTGEYILSASTDGTLKMWDTAEEGGATQSYLDAGTSTWVKVRSDVVTFIGNLDRVMEGRISTDMKSVVSGCRDGTVRIYASVITPGMRESRQRGEFVTISPRITLYGHLGAVNTVAISPDSWRVSTAGDDGSVRVWDLGGTGTPEKVGHEDSCLGVSYLPYGDKVVTVGQEGTMKLWDGKEGLFEKQVVSREERFLACDVDPLGKKGAVACDDGVLRVYELERNQVLITQRHSFKCVKCVKFSHGQGYNIATGAEDGTVKFWNSETGELKCTMDAHVINPESKSKRVGKSVNGVSYENGNFKLVSGSDDKSVKIWYRKFEEPHPKKGEKEPIKKVVVRADEDDDEMTEDEKMYHRMVKAMGARRNEKLAEMSHDERLARQKRKDRQKKSKIAERQERYAAGEDPENFSSSDDDSLLNDADVLQLERELEEEGEEVQIQRVIEGPQEWLLAAELKGHEAPVLDVAYHPNGEQVISCSMDGFIKVWSASVQQLEEELYGKPLPEPEKTTKTTTPVKATPEGTIDSARKGSKASPSSLLGSKASPASRRGSQMSHASHQSDEIEVEDETRPLLSKVGEEESDGEGDEEEEDQGEGKGSEGVAEKDADEKGSVSSKGTGHGASKDDVGPIKVHVSGGKFGSEDEWDDSDDDSEFTFGSTSVASSKRGTMDSNVLSPGGVLSGRGSKPVAARGTARGPPREATGGNTCLYSISVKQGPIRQLAFSPDGLIFVAACEGKIVKGMLVVYDGTTYARIGDFETGAPTLCCAAAGMAPHMVSCGDQAGNFYLLRFGCMEPNTPKPTRVLPDPLPLSRTCTIL